jgi:phage N-6-adenine-methyltransferase
VSLAGFSASNHPQQTARRGVDPDKDDRGTTAEVFDPLHARFRFTLDVAAAAHNAKCARYFTREDNGLAQSWAGESVWCNPPYSDIEPWVIKAWDEWIYTTGIVMLLPANRTDQRWWHDHVEPMRDRLHSPLRLEFLLGRLRFIQAGRTEVGPNERPPFGCCLLIWQVSK